MTLEEEDELIALAINSNEWRRTTIDDTAWSRSDGVVLELRARPAGPRCLLYIGYTDSTPRLVCLDPRGYEVQDWCLIKLGRYRRHRRRAKWLLDQANRNKAQERRDKDYAVKRDMLTSLRDQAGPHAA